MLNNIWWIGFLFLSLLKQINIKVMSKKQTFNVTIEFTDEIISVENIREVARNILRAIVSEANNGIGIAPDDVDALTTVITVTPQFLDEDFSEKVY
jgi:hypothetical protein